MRQSTQRKKDTQMASMSVFLSVAAEVSKPSRLIVCSVCSWVRVHGAASRNGVHNPAEFVLLTRASRNLERLARAIAHAALVISGSLLLLTPIGGWHHLLGEAMVICGIVGMLVIGIGAMRRSHRQR